MENMVHTMNGEFIIAAKYDLAFPFSDGLACINIDDKYGYIDKTGKVVIDRIYESAWPFKSGEALVKLDGEWIYIDINGKLITKENI